MMPNRFQIVQNHAVVQQHEQALLHQNVSTLCEDLLALDFAQAHVIMTAKDSKIIDQKVKFIRHNGDVCFDAPDVKTNLVTQRYAPDGIIIEIAVWRRNIDEALLSVAEHASILQNEHWEKDAGGEGSVAFQAKTRTVDVKLDIYSDLS